MRTSIRPWIICIVLAASMTGCALQSAPPKSRSVATHQSPPPPQITTTQEQRIARLLNDADYALSQNRLLTPIEDNAFDRFQSVLLMDPDNQAAKAGLQAVGLRYVELARNAMNRGQFKEAQSYINNARSIDPGNPLVPELEANLRRARAAQPAPKAYTPGPNETLLDATELTRQSPAVIAQLAQLAQRARQTGELVIIHARTDAEGRWIYSQMREALEDFLLRGDIKISSQPRVEFIPEL